MNRPLRWLLLHLLAGCAAVVWAQTAVDLTSQGRLESGTNVPVHCQTGQLFLKTNTPAGATLYACIGTDTWKIQGVTTSSAVPADQNILRWNAALGQWEPGPDVYTAGIGIAINGNSLATEDSVIPEYYAGSGTPGQTYTRRGSASLSMATRSPRRTA